VQELEQELEDWEEEEVERLEKRKAESALMSLLAA
jgi:hypothetical protein